MALISKGLHILFVDDDADLMDAGSRLLTKLGYHVTGETGSLKALRVFLEHTYDFDLAILDVTMTGISGLELAQRFKQIQPDFPVILYGGNMDSSILHDAEEAGISCCQKPASSEELESAIREVLKR